MHTKYDNEWVRKKRSTTEGNNPKKKPTRLIPSPATHKQKIYWNDNWLSDIRLFDIWYLIDSMQ